MFNEDILKNGETIGSVPNQYKTQEMSYKAVDSSTHELEFVTDRDKTRLWLPELLIITLLQ